MESRVTRWLALSLGLAVAAAALWTLVAGGGPAPPPQGEIDAASRAALERVLAEGESGERRP
jgi:hypothetical protein